MADCPQKNGHRQQLPLFNASEHFFEGAEKLFEIWFDNDQQKRENGHKNTLRTIPENELRQLLNTAGCHILQVLRTAEIDAYLLSESSMFISDRRLILKTCGQTRPLLVIGKLLELARKHCQMDTVTNVYYSRKNFFRPQLQPQLHATFDEEVDYLDGFFQGGSAFCMGPLKHDRWYLYTLTTPRAPLNCSDHTLELQMTGIPVELLSVYSKSACPGGAAECTRRSGILSLLPRGTIVQDELFEPVGYSMNGVPAGDEYVTIHVTPEPEFCYASFETNHRRGCLYEQTLRVLDCFRPGRFILTLFANEHSNGAIEVQQRLWAEDFPGYRRLSVQMLRLQSDTLLFALYDRKDEK
ncbi:hypothetical protein niasHT_011791 [Heterodera trifolii]|uniref:S-adenosylmethionine decarboxylase proenzyme n=1 Tax=Heterodera trifolii TaxID=157864 RepID=A0ABD2L5B5_9BILA